MFARPIRKIQKTYKAYILLIGNKFLTNLRMFVSAMTVVNIALVTIMRRLGLNLILQIGIKKSVEGHTYNVI